MQLSVLIMDAPPDVAALLPEAVGDCDVRQVSSLDEARTALDESRVHVLLAREAAAAGLMAHAKARGQHVVCIGLRDDPAAPPAAKGLPTLTEPVSVEALRDAVGRVTARSSAPPTMVVVADGGEEDLPGTHVHYRPRHTDVEQLLAVPQPGPVVVHTEPGDAQALLRDLRRDPEGARLHVVACSTSEHPRDKSELCRAGADEVWTPSMSPPGAIAERIHMRWEAVSRLSIVPAPSRDGAQSLLAGPGWADMAEVLARNFSDFMGTPVWVGPPRARPVQWSHISLVEVQAQLEVQAAIGGRQDGLTALVELLFGEDAGVELAPDLLRELANVAMGAMKSRWIEDGFAFTSGLPVDGEEEGHVSWTQGGVARSRFRLEADAFEVEIAIGVDACEHRRVPVETLVERMVVAEDLRGEDGALVVAAGTRLTVGLVQSIQALRADGAVLVSAPRTQRSEGT